MDPSSSASSVSTHEEHTNNLGSQREPLDPHFSAIPISPRTSFSSPQVVVGTPTAPLAPVRRPGPISIPPTPNAQRALSPSTSASYGFPSPNPSASTELPPPTKPIRSPIPPTQPRRPDDSTKLYNPGWTHPFPSSQTAPRRPARPARPSEALMFASPLPFPAATFPRTPEQQHAFDNENVDLATFVEEVGDRSPPSSPEPNRPGRGELPRKNSSHRKPVPRYIPTPPPPPTPGRLSIGGFEALLASGVGSAAGSQKRSAALEAMGEEEPKGKRRAEQPRLFSPRVGLGMTEDGVEARKQRQQRDEELLRSGRAVAGPSQLSRGGGGDLGEENIVSWSDRLRQSEWLPAPFYKRPSASGPTLPPPRSRSVAHTGITDWRADGPPTAALIHAHSDSRYRPVQAHTTPAPDRRRQHSTPNLSTRRPSGAFDKHLQEVVVIPSAWDDDSIDGDDVRAREASFRPERMDFQMLEYRSWFPKLVHLLWPLFILAHYPATIFLDYNVIYTLVQIALSPSLPSTSLSLVSRAIVDVPTIRTSTAWWVAVGVYSACTFLWIVVVSVWFDLVVGFVKPWGTGGRVPIGKVYRGASSFNLACMSSYSRFCFLWRVRLAPFRKHSPLHRAVKGTSASDGFADTFSWYSQNWPTVVLLVPRAGLSLAILLLFGTTAYGSDSGIATDRDSGYFHPNGTLTGFATGVLLTNCAWAAYRLVLVVGSYLGLLALSKPFSRASPAFSAYYHPSREHLNVVAETEDDIDEKRYHESKRACLPGWKIRRDRRLRAAILVCLRTSESAQSSPAFSPYFKSTPRVHRTDDGDDMDEAEKKAERRARREENRRAKLALDGIDWSQLDEQITPNFSSPRDGRWGIVSPYVLPSPRVHSPLMTFSPASVSDYPETPAMPSSGGGLHRRVRSIPIRTQTEENEAEELRAVRFDDAPPLSPQSHRSPPPRPLSLHVDDSDSFVPGLKSHFSFISADTNGVRTPGSALTTAPPTPSVVERDGFLSPPPLLRANSSTDVAPSDTPREEEVLAVPDKPGQPAVVVQPSSPVRSASTAPEDPISPASSMETQRQSVLTLGDRPSPGDVRYARHEVLQRQLTRGAIERRLLSEKLLVEVQRLGEAEEAVRREERRLAALRRISEAPSGAETEPNRLSTLSQESGAAVPSSSQPPGLLLPPFRLSYGSHDSSTSLAGLNFDFVGSAVSSPDLDDGAEFGDLGIHSTTAAFLSGGDSSSSSDDEDDDRSLTPTQAGRRREYAIHSMHQFSPETFGVRPSGAEGEGGEQGWAWKETGETMPTSEDEGGRNGL